MTVLDNEQQQIIDKVEKLLRLANKNQNEAEAAAATAKAQELLAAYNLDMAMVGEHGGGDAKREQQRLKGGAYKYQRWLWQAVAELNFCMYWCDQKWIHYQKRRRNMDGSMHTVDWPRLQWHHFLVGRVVNVASTRVMAEYLEQVVERALRERLKDQVSGIVPHNQLFSKWSVSFRTGAMSRIVEKVEERRNEVLAEEHRKKAEAARAGTSTANALTISTYKSAEEDANMDFIYGEGWSAKQAAKRAERAAARRAAEEEYTRWAAAHPEEAAKAAAKARKEEERRASRRSRSGSRRRYKSDSDNLDNGAYFAGYDAAENISIDQQVGDRDLKRIA